MAKRKEHIFKDGVELKHCGGCNNELELTQFSNLKRSWDGLNSRCKSCCYNYMKNSKGVKEYRENYRKENRKILSDKRRARTNSISGKYSSYKSDAKRRDYSFELSIDEFSSMWQKPCSYCGDSIDTIGIDRIDNSLGYTSDNTEPCCKQCNIAKNNMSRNDFLELIKRIYLRNH